MDRQKRNELGQCFDILSLDAASCPLSSSATSDRTAKEPELKDLKLLSLIQLIFRRSQEVPRTKRREIIKKFAHFLMLRNSCAF